MLNPRILIYALMALGVVLPVSARDGPNPDKVVDVQMQCNTMVGAFEVDPVAARAILPAQYELALQISGNALVYLQVSNCGGSGNGEPLGAFDLADVWLAIEGPYEVIDVPGAYVTIPNINVYVLKAQTTSDWIKTHCAAIHFPKELIRTLDVGGPISPLRDGFVVEMTGRAYSWSEFLPCMSIPGTEWGECWMFPDPAPKLPVVFFEPTGPFLLGTNVRGYVDRSPGTGARKELGCLMEVAGQGLVQLQLDPKSNLAELGIFYDGQIGYFWDSIATCELTMSAAE
jgi:hypothetical protein